jgi:phosphoglycerol transferase MdoB-like AlkP superfamily enzyme
MNTSKRNYFSTFLKPWGLKLLVALGIMMLCRVVFWLFNQSYFQDIHIVDFIYGLRFDISVLAYAFVVFTLFSVFDFGWKWKGYALMTKLFYIIPLFMVVAMNMADTIYFRFIFRRSTFDTKRYFEGDGEFFALFGQFVLDFWYIFVIGFALVGLAYWFYNKIDRTFSTEAYTWKQLVWIPFIAGLVILGGRGGFQLVPISIVDAGLYTENKNIPVVLNTPFSVMITAQQQQHVFKPYYTDPKIMDRYYTTKTAIKPAPVNMQGRNVVLFIVESFASEYIGFLNEGKGYTPFLDSLLKQSYVFTNAFANGKQSIDAVPAIVSGIPAYMQDPFTYSIYSSNRIPSLAQYFNHKNYITAFYHGGANGTMGFEAFTKSAGFQSYLGKTQYPNAEKDFDGNWGIFDEPYLQYFSNQLSQYQKPFFATLFTLSSHHPYTIPKQHKNKFPKGDLEIHESIGYTDYALQKFFETAAQQPWFKNTVFIITADHTAQTNQRFHQEGMGMYNVPIAIYDPQQQLKGIDTSYMQHIDILPSVMSLFQENTTANMLGQSMFSISKPLQVMNYNYGTHVFLKDGYQYAMLNHVVVGMYAYPSDKNLEHNLVQNAKWYRSEIDTLMKANIQGFYECMEKNNLVK